MNKLMELFANHRARLHQIMLFGTLAILLGLVNWQIYQKEQHLAHGTKVYLELAPVDPRSLMQGDYMALRFKIADDIRAALKHVQAQSMADQQSLSNSDGYVIVNIDENHIAHFLAIADAQYDGKGGAENSGGSSVKDSQVIAAQNQLRLQYRVRNGQIKFATNAFFFQEGHASVYEAADFGEFRVNSNGEPLLTAMYDADLNKLEYQAEGSEQKQEQE